MVNTFQIAEGKYYTLKTLTGVLEFRDGARKGSVLKINFNDTENTNPHHSHCFVWKLYKKKPLT